MQSAIPDWKHHRIIHSKFPPKNLFDDKNDAKNLLLGELESLSNDRLCRWREFVSPEDFRSGSGWGAVMASFCYISPGRFNTAAFGAYYCADSPHTAIAEWSHHGAKVWNNFRFTDEASAVVRCYTGQFKAPLLDIRGDDKAHSSASYAYSQAKAYMHKVEGANGMVYNSVRNDGGVCAVLFRPPATSPVKQSSHYSVRWNGKAFVEFAKISKYEKI